MSTTQNTFAALSTGIPYTRERMSKAIYDCLCQGQTHEYVYGETDTESLEISWHSSFEEWQIIRRDANGVPQINYDGLHEGSFEWEDPELLLSMCEDLGVVEELQEELEEMFEEAAE